MKKTTIIFSLFLWCSLSFAQTFTLTSKSVGGQASDKLIFNGFGCSGPNISPELTWSSAPAGTKSFAVTMYDPDAPTGSGWWHWVVFDIPSTATGLAEGAGDVSKNIAPKGSIQSITDMGTPGFGGPCPLAGGGFHRYIITVFALKVEKLGVDKNASPAMVGFMLNQQLIEKASLMFYYKR